MAKIRQLFGKPHSTFVIPYLVALIFFMPVVVVTDSWAEPLRSIVLLICLVVFFVAALWVQEVSLPKLWARWFGEDDRNELAQAEQRLESLLNYGGIHLDDTQIPTRLTFQYQDGDVADEIAQMRRIGNAFLELADRVEAQAKHAPDTKIPHTSR